VTAFENSRVDIIIRGLGWEPEVENDQHRQSNATVYWSTSIQGVLVANGTYSLDPSVDRLPESLNVGHAILKERGRLEVTVAVAYLDHMIVTSTSVQVYPSMVAVLPLLALICLAISTKMVEFSLFVAIVLGACIVEGELVTGFKTALDKFILVCERSSVFPCSS
jgi:hypothetical protein